MVMYVYSYTVRCRTCLNLLIVEFGGVVFWFFFFFKSILRLLINISTVLTTWQRILPLAYVDTLYSLFFWDSEMLELCWCQRFVRRC